MSPLIELIYRFPDRDTARSVGTMLDETFHPDQLTALNFLARPDGETLVIAIFAGQTDRYYLDRAHFLLGSAGRRVEVGLRELLTSARERGFTEFYLGDDALRFMGFSTG